MNEKNWLMPLLIAALAVTPLWGADTHRHDGHGTSHGEAEAQQAHGDDPVLPTGEYSARVKTLACDGCAPLIEKTLRSIKEIGPVHVDTKESRVHFSVAKGASIKWSVLQAALNKSAGQMGMGADFTMSNFRMGQTTSVARSTSERLLSSGYYEAKVGAIVCGGCKDLIERTMRSVDGIGAAQADEKGGTVRFAVIKGKNVQLSKLQSSLKVAADQMGMHADYSLSDIKPLKKP